MNKPTVNLNEIATKNPAVEVHKIRRARSMMRSLKRAGLHPRSNYRLSASLGSSGQPLRLRSDSEQQAG